MKTVANVLWLILGGWYLAIEWLLAALLFAITIVGIPFAVQCLKFAAFSLWPFGRTVIDSPYANPLGCLGNIIWFIPGLFLAFSYFIAGILLCITIIGIPFGIQSFKFIRLAIWPFGKEIVKTSDLELVRQSGM